MTNKQIDVSILTTVRNGEQWLPSYFESVVGQDYTGSMEVSIFDDGSSDGTWRLIQAYGAKLSSAGIQLVCSSSVHPPPSSPIPTEAKGVGFGKNAAYRQSSGRYLCFLDADDVMRGDRVRVQLAAAESRAPLTLVGSRFHREPADATRRFTRWANNLSDEQLYSQALTTHGPTLVAPTWFCSRALVKRVGKFRQDVAEGYPEDLEFFYRLLRLGGELLLLREPLVVYRHHSAAASHSVLETTLLSLRNAEVQARLLPRWPSFSIWNAGKGGKRLFQALSPENRAKVAAFIDVDERKVGRGTVEVWDAGSRAVVARVPVLHWRRARPPALIALKLDMTQGLLEHYLATLAWAEGTDFVHLNG